MRSLIVLNPPKAVDGHPIEILEINRDKRAVIPIWLIKIRVTTSTGPVEADVRYDAGKRVTIDTIPQSDEAYRLLLASRGPVEHQWDSGNPLAEAVEEIVRR